MPALLLKSLLKSLLAIPSPTGQEQAKQAFIRAYITSRCSADCIADTPDGLILQSQAASTHQPIALIGHLDTVPDFFEPYYDGDRVYGAGASDMQAGLASSILAFIQLVNQGQPVAFIAYNREENTPLNANGLHDLLDAYSDYFKRISLAIIAEPTNNTVQLGCVGSIHYTVEIQGKAAHSARPWDGENAIYKAAPLITGLAGMQPIARSHAGVVFYDVITLTTTVGGSGRTTVPDRWTGTVNYRYAPVQSPEVAEKTGYRYIRSYTDAVINCTDHAYAGRIIETDLVRAFCQCIKAPIEAKQAWTDVAQLAYHAIPALNYGPGLTAQAHRPDEYATVSELEAHYDSLYRVIKKLQEY